MLTQIRNAIGRYSLGAKNTLFFGGKFSRQVIEAAGRVRIYTRKIEQLSSYGFIGQRAKLKCLIAQALIEKGQLPETGLIKIEHLYFSSWRPTAFVYKADEMAKRLKYIKIRGFDLAGQRHDFAETFVYSYVVSSIAV